MNEQRDELDNLLDEALSSYMPAPPSSGFERRIVARVNERSRRRRTTRMWTLAASLAAVAVIAAFCWLNSDPLRAKRPLASANELALSKKEPSPAQAGFGPRETMSAVPAVSKKSKKRRPKRMEPPSPKLARFPSPAPLTSEERALIQLVRLNPRGIPKELISRGGPIEPIRITAVEIKPITFRWNTKETRCCDQ